MQVYVRLGIRLLYKVRILTPCISITYRFFLQGAIHDSSNSTSVRVCPHSTYFFALTAVTPALNPIQMRKVRGKRGEQKMTMTRNKESRRCIGGCQMLRAYHSLSLLAYCLPLPSGLAVESATGKPVVPTLKPTLAVPPVCDVRNCRCGNIGL